LKVAARDDTIVGATKEKGRSMAAERGVALVTGAGRGIGRAIALALARSGFDVAMASIEEQDDAASVNGDALRAYRFDLAEIDSHGALLDRIAADLGPTTCLVNNAGVTSLVRGDMLDLTPESFDRSVAINMRGTFFLTQAVAKRMLAEKTPAKRSIVTISSANAEIIGENRADYCMTKSSLSMMSKLFASRLAAEGISVYEVRPGIIRTDMTAPATEKYDPFIASGGVPARRWGMPEDVGEAVATLARGDLPFATGIHLDIGGGMQMHRV
jgi:3-oxoacyl-[acyl-carrier protein] reductase